MSNYEFCTDCGAEIEIREEDSYEELFRCSECEDDPLCDRCMSDHNFLHSQGFDSVSP